MLFFSEITKSFKPEALTSNANSFGSSPIKILSFGRFVKTTGMVKVVWQFLLNAVITQKKAEVIRHIEKTSTERLNNVR